jgi:hypothetical protein
VRDASGVAGTAAGCPAGSAPVPGPCSAAISGSWSAAASGDPSAPGPCSSCTYRRPRSSEAIAAMRLWGF